MAALVSVDVVGGGCCCGDSGRCRENGSCNGSGGGGGGYAGTDGVGGNGGGGDCGSSGTANTGGGGGGGTGAFSGTNSGNGGSGVVIIKYPDTLNITVGGSLTSSTDTSSVSGFKITTFTAGEDNISWAEA